MTIQGQTQYSYFGLATFGKVPQGVADKPGFADVAVLGMPFDQGLGFRPGARWGPKAIRDISVRFGLAGDPPGYWDLRSGTQKANCRIVDIGDVQVVPLDWEFCFANLREVIKSVLDNGAIPVTLGGDHSITFPIIQAYEDRGPITIVHFDAHMDYRDEIMGVRYGHGSCMRRSTELDYVEQIVSCGIRSLRTNSGDVTDSLAEGNQIIPPWEIRDNGVAGIADRLPTGKDVYISFDIDGMDPGIAPGTGTPEVGGLTYDEARDILEVVCSRNRIIGMDMVEVSPEYDVGQITSLLAAQLIVETLGLVFPSEG